MAAGLRMMTSSNENIYRVTGYDVWCVRAPPEYQWRPTCEDKLIWLAVYLDSKQFGANISDDAQKIYYSMCQNIAQLTIKRHHSPWWGDLPYVSILHIHPKFVSILSKECKSLYPNLFNNFGVVNNGRYNKSICTFTNYAVWLSSLIYNSVPINVIW